MHYTWWDAVKQLPATHRFVVHEPETPRYARARQKLPYLIRTGVYLGWSDTTGEDDRLEIAIWAPPDQTSDSGYYSCFRLFIEDGMATGAVLFCFYDGTEASPGFTTLQDAETYARANGFARKADNGISD